MTLAPPRPTSAPDGIRTMDRHDGREQMNIVIVGHVDHGKSTLVGRLLADTGSLTQGKLEAVRLECERTGKPFEYAFLLDALIDEQDQGITIDTARCFFKTALRDYIIIDAPGHIEFLKNMISGAARAEAAMLMIDAKEGIRENSRRHGYILGMLGIRQVVVCVNKMDLVGYSQDAFAAIERDYRAFLADIGTVSPAAVIPIAALTGENLALGSTNMPWYQGPTVLAMLDRFAKEPPRSLQPLRMPVQAIYKFTSDGDERRIVAGRIETGRLSIGDEVVFSPSNKTSRIKSIEGFNAPSRTTIPAGWSTGVTLTEEIYITRGDVMSLKDHPPLVGTRFRANLIWLGRKPMVSGREYKLKLHATAQSVHIHQLLKVLDASEVGGVLAKDRIDRHDVADLILECREPIAFDLVSDIQNTGRFVIVDGYDVCGGGIITGLVADEQDTLRSEARLRDFYWVPGGVGAEERAVRYGHRSALVMVTGRPPAERTRYAESIERSLYERGAATYVLNGSNVLMGVDHDLSVDSGHDELVRRFGEVSHLLLNAGLIVISNTQAIGLADHGAVQALIGSTTLVTVVVGQRSDLADCDLRVETGQDTAHVATELASLLVQRGVLFDGGRG